MKISEAFVVFILMEIFLVVNMIISFKIIDCVYFCILNFYFIRLTVKRNKEISSGNYIK